MKSLVAAAIAAASLFGCATELPEPEQTASEEQALFDSDLANQIAQDPSLNEVVAEAVPAMRAHALRFQQMTGAERQAHIELLENLGRVQEEVGGLDELRASYYFDVEMEEIHRQRLALLVPRFGLEDMSLQDVRALMTEAVLRSPSFAVATADATVWLSSCKQSCVDTAWEEQYKLTAAWLAAGVACLPLGPLCELAATAVYLWESARVEDAKQACFDICDGNDSDYCENDDWCEAYEFCDRGTLTIGANKCKHEREEGDNCTRHGQCLSECCKYKPFENLLSATCQVREECE